MFRRLGCSRSPLVNKDGRRPEYNARHPKHLDRKPRTLSTPSAKGLLDPEFFYALFTTGATSIKNTPRMQFSSVTTARRSRQLLWPLMDSAIYIEVAYSASFQEAGHFSTLSPHLLPANSVNTDEVEPCRQGRLLCPGFHWWSI